MIQKRIKKFFLLTSILLAFSVLAKAEEAKVQELNQVVITQYGELQGKEFKMTSPHTGVGITLGFDIRGRVYGSTGLNRFWGEAQIQNGKVKFDKLESTAHNKGSQEQRITEVKYLTVLKDINSVVLKGEELILSTPFDEKLIFQRVR